MDLTIFLASVLAAAPPVLFAVLGETITEKAGVINLSLDGTILLSAMAGFAAALHTGSVVPGILAAMLVGALVAGIVALASLMLRLPQVATGFVLTLLTRDLAYVLGNPYVRVPGPQVPHTPIPVLSEWPVVGRILFDQDPLVYLSLVAVVLIWVFIFRTRPGLMLQGLGEQPAAAYARGADVIRMRYLYTLLGGALVGLGGAAFSLLVAPGWARQKFEGIGWITLAIVIFGNWHPIRATLGAYFFVALQTVATNLQSAMPNVPTQVFPTLPFPLMILTLLLVTVSGTDWMNRLLGRLPPGPRRVLTRTIQMLQTVPPAGLGKVPKRE